MSGLFKTPKMKIPDPAPEVAMPDPEDIRARTAKKNAMMDAQRRRGRESTILGPAADEGAGGGYNRQTLGGSPM
jgi:hypothetical protein